jgi:hypothetical protein
MFFAAYNALWEVIFQTGRQRGDLPEFAYSALRHEAWGGALLMAK